MSRRHLGGLAAAALVGAAFAALPHGADAAVSTHGPHAQGPHTQGLSARTLAARSRALGTWRSSHSRRAARAAG